MSKKISSKYQAGILLILTILLGFALYSLLSNNSPQNASTNIWGDAAIRAELFDHLDYTRAIQQYYKKYQLDDQQWKLYPRQWAEVDFGLGATRTNFACLLENRKAAEKRLLIFSFDRQGSSKLEMAKHCHDCQALSPQAEETIYTTKTKGKTLSYTTKQPTLLVATAQDVMNEVVYINDNRLQYFQVAK